jgi:hypothetical protein
MEAFATKKLPERYDAIAPDGSEVRILARVDRGSAAHFQLEATGSEPLKAFGVTMPPWPGSGEGEVEPVTGTWTAKLPPR